MGDDRASESNPSLTYDDPRAAEHRRVERHNVLRELQSRLFGRARRQIVLGRYIVREQVGSGGFGAVYRAFDPSLERDVAIKILRGTSLDPRDGAALLAESRIIAGLDHPNVVRVWDVGLDDEFEPDRDTAMPTVYVVLELLDGAPLDRWIVETRPEPDRVLQVLQEAGAGIAAVHEAGIAHGDIKPANIVVDASGRARVVDFGLAHRVGRELETTERSTLGASKSSAPRFARGGTPLYMAPEAALAGDPTLVADQFSLALVMAEALIGELPYDGTKAEVADAKRRGLSGAELVRAGLDARIAHALARSLSPRPEERYPSVRAMLDAMTPRRRPPVVAVATVAVGIGLGAVLWSARTAPRCESYRAKAEAAWAERREAIRERFDRWSAPYAGALHERVVGRLDDVAEAWTERADVLCADAPAVTPTEADQIELCLDARLAELEAVLEVLATGGSMELRRSMNVIAEVGDPSFCAPEQLESAMVSADPEVQATIAALRQDLFDGQAKLATGDIGAARAAAQTVLERARALELGPVEAEATYELGNAAVAAGRPDEAVELLERAYFSAETLGHDRLMAAASSRLVLVAGRQLENTQLALRWGEWARAAIARLKDPASALASLEYALGVVALRRGDLDLAARQYEHALELYRELGARGDIAATLNGLAVTHKEKGDPATALELLEEAYALESAELGPLHPDASATLSNLGLAALELGDGARAATALTQVVDTRRASLGGEHPDVAAALVNLSVVDYTIGRYDVALERLDQAAEIIESSLGQHPMLAIALDNAGACRRELGDPQAAIPLHRHAIEIQERALPELHEQRGTTLANYGLSLALGGQRAQSDAAFEQAEVILGGNGDASRQGRASLLAYVAMAKEHRGDDGRNGLRRALELLERDRPRPLTGQVAFALAQAELARGATTESVAAAQRARSMFEQLGNQPDQQRVEDWLSNVSR